MSTDRPRGWGTTRTGSMLHYFGTEYRPDGTALALCHNALVADPDEALMPELPSEKHPRRTSCVSCYEKKRRQDAQVKAGQLTTAQKVVTRGKYAGMKAEIIDPHPDFTGFYWCWIEQVKIKGGKAGVTVAAEPIKALLNSSQLSDE